LFLRLICPKPRGAQVATSSEGRSSRPVHRDADLCTRDRIATNQLSCSELPDFVIPSAVEAATQPA
jgi:hypothetical protein